MDNEEIADLIAGREEDIAGWEREHASASALLERLPGLISLRTQWIAQSRARIAELKQRMENGQWLTQ